MALRLLKTGAPFPCPLCGALGAATYHRETNRDYWRCHVCELVFLSPPQRLSLDEEVARYRTHRNTDDDPEYLKFLSRLADPMIERVPVGSAGLDYGSGQSSALALLLSRTGRPTVAYDPVFRPDASLLKTTYDFVTCSEVVEHVHDPHALLKRFEHLLARRGTLGIMTSLYHERIPFGEWWYRRDPTHVCFYHENTMRWIAHEFGWAVALPAPNIAIFTMGADHGVA